MKKRKRKSDKKVKAIPGQKKTSRPKIPVKKNFQIGLKNRGRG